jgi:membrane-associated protease RseP (regulator of RpoE activity)
VREYVAPEFLPSMPSLVFADLRSIATDDELAARLGRERGLRILIVSGPELTDRGLIALWEAPQLERVVLIDCPRISTPVLKKLRSAQPSRLINLRGPALLGINGIDVADGCRLLHVEAASAAELAGLLPGDVITTFNGRPVTGFEPLSDLIAEHKPGETVTLSFLRGSESQQVRPVLQAWKAAGRSRLRRK